MNNEETVTNEIKIEYRTPEEYKQLCDEEGSEMNYDIYSILLKKQIELKDEEYNILKVTSEQLEEEQQREIYELKQTINKAKGFLWNYLNNTVGNPDHENFVADDDIGFAYKTLNGEGAE